MVLETVRFHLSRASSRSSCLLPTFNQGKCKKDSLFIVENIHKPQISNKEHGQLDRDVTSAILSL